MNSGVVQADKNLRKKFIIFLGLTMIAVLLIVPYFNDYIEQIKQISKENPELAFKKSMFMLKLTLGIVSFLLLMTGVYFIIKFILSSLPGELLSLANTLPLV